MKSYRQSPNVGEATRFAKSPMADVEHSRLIATPTWLLPFNAGDIVPVYYAEVLPHDTFSIDLDFVIRQTTVLRPTMGQMQVDFFAFFVPNRIINDSWKNVMGENTSGYWTAPEVDLAPLYATEYTANDVQIPVGSVADYYGFPTQAPIKGEVLYYCNDLKFRGYLDIYNNYFRDQNYQPPIPFSKLNVYEGFLQEVGTPKTLEVATTEGSALIDRIGPFQKSDGSFSEGAVAKALYGEGDVYAKGNGVYPKAIIYPTLTTWSALDKPLKANKLHDAFTSALPSPQKGAEVYFGIGDTANVTLDTTTNITPFNSTTALKFGVPNSSVSSDVNPVMTLSARQADNNGNMFRIASVSNFSGDGAFLENSGVTGSNLVGIADLSEATGVSVNELRTAIATQQVYEALSRGGSRYTSVLRNFFELDIESPFADIPTQLGHIRRDLDLYQVAQTSSSDTESPQGNLTAFGYTTSGGHLFTKTFLEHGYIHIFAVVRQKKCIQ